ncbi:TPM domain-containing protein [Prochlorococcus sp. MIT 1341]|uniref:TPM domain-containing protein n=1 Tax=Prochlorococcus sp. MIT 1341 TaxID=3096221 RepID=UPI002A74AE0F|nr:TPM domain-containing protein [Prochlorococcus sp. MIT 1341]
MRVEQRQRCFTALLCLILSLILSQAAFAYDNPDLLPDHQTSVIDLARVLTEQQRTTLDNSLQEYENETGWKLRVLTQFEKTPGLAVRDFWQLDERSVLVIADPRGGNLLNFNVGDALFALMPRLFWVELQTRYGNQYYVRDNGEDGSVLGAINAIETCLDRGGCQLVPGLPKEQSLWSLVTSILGGLIAGFAAFPKKEGAIISWGWLALFSPLWIMLFGIFGIAPVITRTTELLPVARNCLGFIGSIIAAYLVAQAILTPKTNSE